MLDPNILTIIEISKYELDDLYENNKLARNCIYWVGSINKYYILNNDNNLLEIEKDSEDFEKAENMLFYYYRQPFENPLNHEG